MALPNTDIEKLYFDYNFTGQNPEASAISSISLSQDINQNYIISFTIFEESDDLNGTYYQGFKEQTDFADGSDYLQ